MQKITHIAIAFDKNYLHQAYALLASVFANNRGMVLHVHSIITGLETNELNKLKKYVNDSGAHLFAYSVDEELVEKFVLVNRWTQAVYYRLFFPFLVPSHVSRLLYLDADAVVVGNLAELYDQSLGFFPIAAVYDNYVKKQPLLGIDKEGNYFNSGVLLINTELWRKQRVTERAIEYLDKYPERILFVDQCALNAVLINNWKKLDYRFNVLYSYVPPALSLEKTKVFLRDKVIIHFTLERPWKFICRNRLRYLYHQFLAMSPLGKQPIFADFEMSALPQWVKLHLTELYFDTRFMQRMWRFLKQAR